jgi:C4-dicarboxylate-specific signal transduction histidine kinase
MGTHSAPSLRRSTFVRYTVSVATVIGAVLITIALQTISPKVPGSLIFCAAIYSGWFGGIGPGLLAAFLSSAAIALKLPPPPYPDPSGSAASELPRLAVYSTAVFVIAWISGRQRQAEEMLQQSRDELEEKVRGRTAELKHSNDELQAEIAERMAAEEALQTMEAELAHVSRLTMMGELTASIAHEVNQPLGAIMNYANASRRLLAADVENTAQIDLALSNIADDARRASDVIARIRALSKKKPTEKAPSTVRDLMDDVLAIAKFKMLARGVTARVDLAADLPRLHVDRVQIQQVLLNLISNGMEAMETVPPRDRFIEISARLDRCEGEPAVNLGIRDHGTGVKPADQTRLFEPFYSTKSEGMGLGLAISRSIVESHGGRLSLVATQGAGATFHILLPVQGGSNP